ncbi:MAG: biotin--[acetyl-CoA-carboxylase] ligase [Pyrinomonadaceae bacterium]|nr:biotin--[acetyl-CoA-carboxylase] ligase [Pyrinomonadaceae bacterium]
MQFTILRHDILDSTNSQALKQAKLGAKEGLCILAKEQTSGRGRQGRNWVSGKNSGLYFSIVLRPNIDTKYLSLITLMTSVVVYEVLVDRFGLVPDIKWSNDVLIGEKKVSGILAETSDTPGGLAVVVGIGINLNSGNISGELSDTATSIRQETGKDPDIEKLLTSLTSFFSFFYDLLQGENGPGIIRKEWAKRSSYIDGKAVRATLENKTVSGTTCGLDENGALRIKTESGRIESIQAGDVEMLRKS